MVVDSYYCFVICAEPHWFFGACFSPMGSKYFQLDLLLLQMTSHFSVSASEVSVVSVALASAPALAPEKRAVRRHRSPNHQVKTAGNKQHSLSS